MNNSLYTDEKDAAAINLSAPPSVEPVVLMDSGLISFPDGGRSAWLTVLGGFLAFVVSVGYISSFSVFQTYYGTYLLPDHTPDQISWIGGMQIWGCFFLGILSGSISDSYGPKLPVGLGGLILVFGTMMTSLSTQYYQIVLSQGLCSAVGLGLMFTPSLSIQSQWFSKRRGLAVGIVMSGQNVGGTCRQKRDWQPSCEQNRLTIFFPIGIIWPILADSLLNKHSLSFAWTLRILGFVQLALLIVAVALIQRRFPSFKSQLFDMKNYFTSTKMVLFTASNFVVFLSLYIPYVSSHSRRRAITNNANLHLASQFYISLYSINNGFSFQQSFYTPAILNGAACIGCYVCGVMADRYVGYFNVLTGACLLCAMTTFAWIAVHSNAGVIAWTAGYGFLTGGIQTTFSPCIALLTPSPQQIGTWNGTMTALCPFLVLSFTNAQH